jgi:hypothetical protein
VVTYHLKDIVLSLTAVRKIEKEHLPLTCSSSTEVIFAYLLYTFRGRSIDVCNNKSIGYVRYQRHNGDPIESPSTNRLTYH